MAKLSKEVYKYVPVFKQAPMDMKYHYYDENKVLKVNEGLFTLARSIQDIKDYVANVDGKIIGVDTETTGLTYGEDQIVGFSISTDIYSGIYVPIRHKLARKDTIKELLVDGEGKPLLTKTGKQRTKTVTKETLFDNPLNLPEKEALDILYDAMRRAKLNIFHNSEFDLTMIRQEGYDVMKCNTFDSMVLTYLYDSENKMWNKLKEASKIVLGRYPMKFYEALGTEKNFQTVDLEKATPYAASDSANCLGLFLKLYPEVTKLLAKCPMKSTLAGEDYNPLKADNQLIRAFTDYYQHVDLLVDRKAAEDYKIMVEENLAKVDETIFSYFKKGMFNLSPSSKEFQNTMKEFNMETGAKTDTGAVSYGKGGIAELDKQLRALKEILMGFKYIDYKDGTLNKRASANEMRLANFILVYGKDFFQLKDQINSLKIKSKEGVFLDKINFFEELKLLYKREKGKLNVLVAIQQRSSLTKALNSYITKLTEVDSCHMRYRLQGTASGRLSSGNGSKTDTRKNHYFIDLNAQNLTKPHSAYYRAFKSDAPDNILGWGFEMVSEDYYREHKDEEIIVEGSDPKGNIRNCLVSPSHRYIASLDYSAQEYRVLAILSKDHKMINNFLNDLDPHTATAYAIWGEDHYDRQKRKKAKGCVGDNVLITTTRGLVPASKLQPDDMLIGVDGKPQKYAKVTETNKLLKIRWSNGITSELTPNHPVQVWTGSKIRWKAASTLTPTDEVISYVGGYPQETEQNIQKINVLSMEETVGNVNIIETENHTYIADFVGSHNCNFLMNYMGGAYTLAQNLDIPLQEAEDIIKKYEQAYFECIAWKKNSISDCLNKQDAVAYSAVGRPRQFKSRLSSSFQLLDPEYRAKHLANVPVEELVKASDGMKKATERRIVSHLIQSICGDICRSDLLRLYRRFFKDRDPHIDFYSTVHDEINFSIDKDKVVEYVREIDDIMTITDLHPQLPIITSIDLGHTLGVLFPFEWANEERTELRPLRA